MKKQLTWEEERAAERRANRIDLARRNLRAIEEGAAWWRANLQNPNLWKAAEILAVNEHNLVLARQDLEAAEADLPGVPDEAWAVAPVLSGPSPWPAAA